MTPRFSVFTPTYNRAALLRRVFESLRAQTFLDFEWIVVDDGSTDETPLVVPSWQHEAPFPIRYRRQVNRGKHVAINRGAEAARGELFVIVDSDDWLAGNALERMHAHWCSIPPDERHRFAGVVGLYALSDGRVNGGPFPTSPLVASSVDVRVRHGKRGDSFGCNRTELLRQHPFPEDMGRFVAESLTWNRIARQHVQLCVNEIFAYTEYRQDGLTADSLALRTSSPAAARLNYQELLRDHHLPLGFRVRAGINYLRFCFHAGCSPKEIAHGSPSVLEVAALLPLAWVVFLRDRRRLRRRSRSGAS